MKCERIREIAALLVLALSLLLAFSGASASSQDGAVAVIENIGPVETVRGYLSGNPDDTYFPGDFVHVKVRIRSAGKRGVTVTDRWRTFETRGDLEDESPWYGDNERDDDNVKGEWYGERENAADQADEELSRPDVIDAGVENSCVENSCLWRAWWIDRDWRVELLELKPLADVYVYNASAGGTSVDYSPSNLEPEEGEYVTRSVFIKLGTGTDPGRYEVKIEMTRPHGGHNNPYADVSPIAVADNAEVVRYAPVIRRIPYISPYWKPESTSWMIQKPSAVVTRYDGSKDENDEPSLTRRAVASGVSVSGRITKPLRANGLYLQVDGSGDPKWSGRNGELRLSLENEGLFLAQNAEGEYYSSGSIVSPVFDAENFTGSPGAVWEGWEVTKDTPGETGVKVYIRAGNEAGDGKVEGDWTLLEEAETDGAPPDRRYFQYWMILYTGDREETPEVEELSLSTTDPGEGWSISRWEDGRKEGDPMATPSNMNYFRSNRHTLVWCEGEVMGGGGGAPETGVLKVTPGEPDVEAFPYTPITLELEPQELPDRLRGKTDTLQEAPSTAALVLQDVTLFRTIEKEGKKVFIFAPGGTNVGGFNVAEETSFRYGAENRYEKWNFFFHPDWTGAEPYCPRFLEWFRDATVGLNVGLWFHQKASQDGFEGETLKRVFTTRAKWAPIADHQPIRIAAWDLKDWAEDDLAENPGVVLQDNAWRVDGRVHFRFRFTSMQSPENFLRATKEVAGFLEEENAMGFEEGLETYSEIREWMENLGLPVEEIPEIGEEDAGSMRKTLLSVAAMDNEMLQMILDDLERENAGPQLVHGEGSARDNVEYRIGGYFTLEESVWIPGEGVEGNLLETASLPFDPNREVEYNINLSGEGLAAEVVRETSEWARIRVYDPPRSGGLRSVRVYDNEGELLMSENFALATFGWFPSLGEGEERGWHEVAFTKWEGSPAELTLVLTNEWGATTTQTVRVSPGEAPGEGIGFQMSWKWVVLAIFAAMAWVVAVRKWREKKRGRKKKRLHPPF